MKTREVIFDTSTTLTLLDAYENPKASIEVSKDTPMLIPVPFKREVYQDTQGNLYYIYEGSGTLKHTHIALPFFIPDKKLVDSFDRFLSDGKCEDSDEDFFSSIYKILDLNSENPGYIKHPQVQELESEIIKKSGVRNA